MKNIITLAGGCEKHPDSPQAFEWEGFVIHELPNGCWELNYINQPLNLHYETIEEAQNGAVLLHDLVVLREGLCGCCWDHFVALADVVINAQNTEEYRF